MPSILLPAPPDREAILACWVTLTGLLTALLAAVLGSVGSLTITSVSLLLLSAMIVGAVGFLRERIAARAYRAWDRAARRFARRAHYYVAAVWYWTVITVVASLSRDPLDFGKSEWRSRAVGISTAATLPAVGGAAGAPAGGIREYARWTLESHNLWAITLVPLFLMLQLLQTGTEAAAARDIYTLY